MSCCRGWRGLVFAHGKDALVAFDAESGEQFWITEGKLGACPASTADAVLVSSSGYQLIALDHGTGDEAWAVDLEQTHWPRSMTVIGGRVYFGSHASSSFEVWVGGSRIVGGGVHAVDLGPRSVAWFTNLMAVSHPPVVVSDAVYVSASSGDNMTLHRLDRESGAVIWKRHGLDTAPAVTGDLVVAAKWNRNFKGMMKVTESRGVLLGMDPADGQTRFEFDASIPPGGGQALELAAPVVIDGVIIFAVNHVLYAVKPGGWITEWTSELPWIVDRLIPGPDELLLATTDKTVGALVLP